VNYVQDKVSYNKSYSEAYKTAEFGSVATNNCRFEITVDFKTCKVPYKIYVADSLLTNGVYMVTGEYKGDNKEFTILKETELRDIFQVVDTLNNELYNGTDSLYFKMTPTDGIRVYNYKLPLGYIDGHCTGKIGASQKTFDWNTNAKDSGKINANLYIGHKGGTDELAEENFELKLKAVAPIKGFTPKMFVDTTRKAGVNYEKVFTADLKVTDFEDNNLYSSLNWKKADNNIDVEAVTISGSSAKHMDGLKVKYDFVNRKMFFNGTKYSTDTTGIKLIPDAAHGCKVFMSSSINNGQYQIDIPVIVTYEKSPFHLEFKGTQTIILGKQD